MDLVAKKCQPTNDRINVGNSINITLKYKFESLDDMEKQIGKKYKDFADFFRQIL
jgi:hypothetical protein